MNTTSYPTPGPLALDVNVPSGEIVITASDSEVTTLSISGERDPDEITVTFHEPPSADPTAPSRLQIEYRRRPRLGWFTDRRLLIEVGVPTGAAVKVESGSADLSVTGRLGSVTMRSGSGRAMLGDVVGDVDISVASGDATVGEIGGDITFNSASGGLRAGAIGGRATVRTASGSVALGPIAGDVRCTTVSGDVNLAGLRAGTTALRTVSGDVTVGVCKGSRLYLDLSSVSGRTESDLLVSDQPGSGEHDLDVRAATVSGDIKVRRSAA